MKEDFVVPTREANRSPKGLGTSDQTAPETLKFRRDLGLIRKRCDLHSPLPRRMIWPYNWYSAALPDLFGERQAVA